MSGIKNYMGTSLEVKWSIMTGGDELKKESIQIGY